MLVKRPTLAKIFPPLYVERGAGLRLLEVEDSWRG